MDRANEIIKVTSLESGILQLSLNRPEQLNALNHQMLEKLTHLFHEIKYNHTIRAILLTGEGKAFCAGADIKQLAAIKSAQEGLVFAKFGQATFRSLELLGKPSLAAIHGVALGGGCELAMAATLRIATDNTMFGQPEIKLGVIPGFGGTQRLTRLIGKGRALEICSTGRRFSAEEALQWGLVNQVTTLEKLIPQAKALLKEWVQLSPNTLQSLLTVIHQGDGLPLEQALELEAAHFALCCTTADKREGVSAFLEKRTAVFSGE